MASEPMMWVLKRLLMPKHKITSQSLGVNIPEICFYSNGEAQVLYLNMEPS